MRVLLFILFFAVVAHSDNFRICEFAEVPTELPVEGFRHKRNGVASIFDPYHSANDAIATFGKNAFLEGKFNYGLLGKDLFDEEVEIWVDNCSGHYVRIYRAATDSSGRIVWSMPTEIMGAPGSYKVWMRVIGDGTGTFLTLRVVPKETKVAIFDIDGTLTTAEDDVSLEVISELIGGSYSPPKRDFGPELSRYLHDHLNYQIIYLSGRHYFLNDLTRNWLARNDFAPGSLIVTQSFLDIFPTNGSNGKFKLERLTLLKEAGVKIERAYGNAETDVFAYRKAGINPNKIFIVGRHSGLAGTMPLGLDFTSHYHEVVSGENASDD